MGGRGDPRAARLVSRFLERLRRPADPGLGRHQRRRRYPYAGSTRFPAIIELARAFAQPGAAALPGIADKDDYYAASLTLLAAIAQREIAR